jgi:hypothetical protein
MILPVLYTLKIDPPLAGGLPILCHITFRAGRGRGGRAKAKCVIKVDRYVFCEVCIFSQTLPMLEMRRSEI